ncbi:hypothetical protein F4553_004525 [Allocatelliglobosispora scoriae]|uniref:Aerobactin siderophore biosynthesis IucA/IucC-like C-terminal domain-containing protein n=1 Tax=Allocatelliglobosispora scoriae TaxID=643052 RepID=A0A841BUL9_9ACTN|nr:hypothetical protein [Allocatelliglobosispora scoriae]MBB5871146.1 hypothetical protein [Allocatelliglobosispora scoriae]
MTAPAFAATRAPARTLSCTVPELHNFAWEPIEAALSAMRSHAGEASTAGLATPFFAADRTDWTPAATLVSGDSLTALLDVAAHRWSAAPHAAAALAWKSYSYWASLPIVLGWASARRVPLLTAGQTLVRLSGGEMRFAGAAPDWAVLPDDPFAMVAPVWADGAKVIIAPDEEALLRIVRETLLDQHLDPLLDGIRERVRIGRRTLLGSVASGISYGMIRAEVGLPCGTQESLARLLTALDLDDLVEVSAEADGLAVRRKTCCLAFTLDQPKVCSGCCIR